MQKTPPEVTTLSDPGPFLGTGYIDFLKRLTGPARIDVAGVDRSRCRGIVTLLHGNEPSGLKAIHRLLREGVQPATDLIIIVASVNAALHLPLLSHRFLPWETDLNRCFKPPYLSDQAKLARNIIEHLQSRPIEAVVDTHNTSAHSVPFVVSTNDKGPIRALAGLFADNLIVMDQRLGTLLEHGTGEAPWFTVEFGGMMNPEADRLAYGTLRRYVTTPELTGLRTEPGRTIIHPLRLEIAPQARLHYSSSVIHDSHITMFNTIDQLNFQTIEADTALGWLSPSGLDHFSIRSSGGTEDIGRFFRSQDGFLTTRTAMTIFMATTDPYIAVKDCLLYLTPEGTA
jgi:hypothetical protein